MRPNILLWGHVCPLSPRAGREPERGDPFSSPEEFCLTPPALRWDAPQPQAKYAPSPQFAFEFHPATHPLYHSCHNRQSQSHAAFPARPRLVHPVKPLENSLLMLRRDARPLVGDLDDYRPFVAERSHAYRLSTRTITNGVLDQIHHGLPQ